MTTAFAAAVLLPAAASAGSFHVLFPQQLETTVVQGQSTTFTMDVQPFGAVPCSDTTAPILVDELFSVDAVGDIAAGQAAPMPIVTDQSRGTSDNCYVQDPIQIPMTVTAASDTPVGDYTTTVPYSRRGSDALDQVGPPLTIHVIAAQAETLPTPDLAPPEVLVLGDREAPQPVLGKSVMLTLVKGSISYRAPGQAVKSLATSVIAPNGTLVDARAGVVKVTVVHDKSGTLDSVDTWGGTYVVNQDAHFARPLTSLVLTAVSNAARNAASAARGKKGSAKNLLWANGKGNFKTRGKRASAIVRGTYWLTEEIGSSTKVSVRRGLVAVRDFVRKRTVLVGQGQSYTATPRSHVARRIPAFTGSVR